MKSSWNVLSGYCRFFLSITLMLGIGFLFAGSAYAQTPSSALTIIPPKFELFANPGDQITERIRVRNDSAAPATYSILVEDFTTSGEEGQVVLEEEEQAKTTYSLAKWIEPSTKDLILQPKEERSFTFNINVPRSAEPGGHYASILFQTGADVDVKGGAKVAQRVGSLVLLRVSGNVVENATLENFTAPTYSEKGPVTFLARVKNDSNTHIRPEGTIVITNFFGKKVAELPFNGLNVLPGATRKMETKWEQANILGSYTATLIATYGQTKHPFTAAAKFTVIPRMVLILGFIAAVALIGFIITLFFGRKRLSKILQVLTKG